MENSSKKKNNYNIILEDDIIIAPNFKKKLNRILENINLPFDILYLGGSNIHGKKITNNLIKPISKRKHHNVGMFGLLINKKCIDKLLKHHLPIKNDIDITIKKLFSKLNIYYIYPPLVTHNNHLDSIRRIYSNQSKKASKKWINYTQNNITIL